MAIKEKIVITADDKTARAFRSVQRSAKRTGGDLAAMSRKMAGVALVGAAAAAGLFLLTKRAIENADAIAKNADAMGINVEALQEYRFAAELSGIETQKFDASLVQFTKRIGEAGADTGSLVEFLKKYDETLIDAIISTNDTGEALDVTLSIMADMEKQTDRAAFAAAAFGRSGVVMTNMLRDGKAGLQEMRDEAQRLGIVLSEDAVRGAEAANDAMLRMEKIVGVNLQKVLLSAAPIIEDLGIAFADAAPQIQRAAEAFASFIFAVDIRSLQTMKLQLEETEQAIRDWYDAGDGAGAQNINQQRYIDNLQDERDQIVLNMIAREAELEQRRESIKLKIEDRKGASDEAAAAAAAKAVAAEKVRAQALLLAIEETNMQIMGHEAELIDKRAEQQIAKLKELEEKGRISQIEFLEAEGATYMTALMQKQELEAETEAAITANQKAEFDKREEAARALADAELRARRGLHDGLSAIASLMNVQNRKAFEIGKVGAASLALLKTYEGAQSVFASAAAVPVIGWLLAPVAMAAAVVSGLANVQTILSTSYGGGGGGGRGRSGGGVSIPSVPSPDVPALAPPPDGAGVPTTVFLNFDSESGMISTEWLRDEFFPQFNEAIGDGINIVAT